ncbi:MAG: type II toxin-antitoxin system HicA family toxin [Nitrospirota bacterium]
MRGREGNQTAPSYRGVYNALRSGAWVNSGSFPAETSCKILEKHNFQEVRRRGCHVVMQRQTEAGTVTVPVPDHSSPARNLSPDTVRSAPCILLDPRAKNLAGSATRVYQLFILMTKVTEAIYCFNSSFSCAFSAFNSLTSCQYHRQRHRGLAPLPSVHPELVEGFLPGTGTGSASFRSP